MVNNFEWWKYKALRFSDSAKFSLPQHGVETPEALEQNGTHEPEQLALQL